MEVNIHIQGWEETEAVLEVIYGFFDIYSDFVSIIPLFRTTFRTGIGSEIFLGINVNHSSA